MYKGKRIAIVVPAYNEGDFITQTIETLPHFVDRVYVVNAPKNREDLESVPSTPREQAHTPDIYPQKHITDTSEENLDSWS